MPRPVAEWFCRNCSVKDPSLFYFDKKNICKACVLAKCKENKKQKKTVVLLKNEVDFLKSQLSEITDYVKKIEQIHKEVKKDAIRSARNLEIMAQGSAQYLEIMQTNFLR